MKRAFASSGTVFFCLLLFVLLSAQLSAQINAPVAYWKFENDTQHDWWDNYGGYSACGSNPSNFDLRFKMGPQFPYPTSSHIEHRTASCSDGLVMDYIRAHRFNNQTSGYSANQPGYRQSTLQSNVSFSNNSAGACFSNQEELTVEFWFRTRPNFSSTTLIDAPGLFKVSLDGNYLEARVTVDIPGTSGTVATEEIFRLPFTQQDRRSYAYYTDGEWHHIVLTYQAANADPLLRNKISLYVDGYLDDCFTHYVNQPDCHATTNPCPNACPLINPSVVNPVYPLSNGLESLYFGVVSNGWHKVDADYDELAVYNDVMPGAMVCQHYTEIMNLAPQQPYVYSLQPSGAGCAVTAPTFVSGIVQDQFPTNYPNVTEMSVDQINRYPVPRFHDKQIHFNYPFLSNLDVLGDEGDVTLGPNLLLPQRIANVVAIQDELSRNFHYAVGLPQFARRCNPWNWNNPTGSYFAGLLQLADQNPDFPRGITTFWGNNNPGLAFNFHATLNGGANSLPAPINGAYVERTDLDPSNYYSGNTKLSMGADYELAREDGRAIEARLEWLLSANPQVVPGTTANPDKCGNQPCPVAWPSSNDFRIDYICENGEVRPKKNHLVVTDVSIQSDPVFQNIAGNGNTSPTQAQRNEYLATAKLNWRQEYRDQFLSSTHPTLASKMGSVEFSYYNISGSNWGLYDYDIMRTINSNPNNNFRYATPYVYPQAPGRWNGTVSVYTGLDAVIAGRRVELAPQNNDPFFAPFISPGFRDGQGGIYNSGQDASSVRPGQWLGLTKVLAGMGAEYFHVFMAHHSDAGHDWRSEYVTWQLAIPSYTSAITDRVFDLYRNSDLLEGDRNYYEGGIQNIQYLFWANNENNAVSIRKGKLAGVNDQHYLIFGNINTSATSSLGENSPRVQDVSIDLNASLATGANEWPLQFELRRQGSVYHYDAMPATAAPAGAKPPVFIQLDGWHQVEHPMHWSADFAFEAELFDADQSSGSFNYEPWTKVPGSVPQTANGEPLNGDYREFTSYLTMWDGGSAQTFAAGSRPYTDYRFQPRDAAVQSDLYLYVRARSKSGTSTALTAGLFQGNPGDASPTMLQTHTVPCIVSNEWHWYRLDNAGNAVLFSSLQEQQDYILRLEAHSTDLEIDQFLLSADANVVHEVGFLGQNIELCTGLGATLTAPQGTQYTWSNSATTQSIAVTATTTSTYSVTVSDGAGCTIEDAIEVIAVPLPAAVTTPAGPIDLCAGDQVVLEAEPNMCPYTWSTGATTPSITVSNTGTYGLTITDPETGCSNSNQVQVTVHADPTASVSANQSICAGTSANLLASGGASYQWDNVATLNNSQIAGPQATPTATTTYSVTVDNGFGCTDVASTTITVLQNPVVSMAAVTALCANVSPVGLAGTPTGGVFAGPGVSGSTFDPQVAGAGSHVLSYSFTDANGCTATAFTTAEVFAIPAPQFAAAGPFCVDAGSQVLSATPAGGNFAGAGISGNVFDPAAAGAGSHTVTYTITNSNGCTESVSQSIVVHALPQLIVGQPMPVCVNGGIVPLSVLPTGGTFTGTGVAGSNFDPAVAGDGFHTITYTYTDANGCTATTDFDIEVFPLPTLIVGQPVGLCANDAPVPLSALPSGGTWSGSGVAGGMFDPSIGAGNYSLTYTYTSADGCTVSSSVTATVDPVPVVSIAAVAPLCDNDNPVTLVGSPAGGTFSGSCVSGGQFDPACAGAGTHTVMYSYTSAAGCTGTATLQIVVNASPAIGLSANGPIQFCDGGSVVLTASGGGTYNWLPGGATSSSITVTSSGMYAVTVSNSNGCSATEFLNVTVHPLPTVGITPDGPTTLCQGDAVVLMASNGGFEYEWSTGESFQEIYVTQSGTYTVTVTDANGCTAVASQQVTVNPLPVANAGPDATICQGDAHTLVASGGTKFDWGNGQSGIPSLLVSPGASTNYTVTVTDQNGCSATDDVTVNVIAGNADLGGDFSVCAGSCVTLSLPYTDSCYSYNWYFYYNGTQISFPSTSNELCLKLSSATTWTIGVELSYSCNQKKCVWTDEIEVTVLPKSSPLCPGLLVSSACCKSGGGVKNAKVLEGAVPTTGSIAHLALYPNPMAQAGLLEIEVDESQPIEATLHDIQGNLVSVIYAGWIEANGTNQYVLDVAGLANGIYYVRLNHNDGVQMLKLVKSQ